VFIYPYHYAFLPFHATKAFDIIYLVIKLSGW